MKSLMYLFIVAAAVLTFNLNADVAKPKKANTTVLPAIWNSVSPQGRLKALRVAQLDAYRALAARVYGFQISTGTTVYDYALDSDTIHSRLDKVLQGATELEKPEYNADGMVMVVYGIKLRKVVEILKIDKSFNQLVMSKEIQNQDKVIEALGCGALPKSKAMNMLRAKRAAELDAYRLMAERLAGVKISGETTVAGLCLKSDKMQASLVAFLKGLKPTAIKYKADGSCAVTVQLKIREVVETVENLVKVYNSGAKEKISEMKITTSDKIFKVTGHGAPRSNEAAAVPDSTSGKLILQKVISKHVVVD